MNDIRGDLQSVIDTAAPYTIWIRVYLKIPTTVLSFPYGLEG